jgi:hypothetical protein
MRCFVSVLYKCIIIRYIPKIKCSEYKVFYIDICNNSIQLI